MSAIADMIVQAATRYGVDPRAMLAIGKIESGLRPDAQNPRSSAGGLFQFIDSTARQYGLTNKMDPAANADAAARLARDNSEILMRALGRAPTPGELYLAHQQGAGGATKLLANPDVPAANLVGSRAVALNAGTPGILASQYARMWSDKIGRAMGETPPTQAPADGGIAGSIPAPIALTPDPSILALQAYSQLMQQPSPPPRREEDERMARRRALFSRGGVADLYR